MGEVELAQADYHRLLDLDSDLAKEPRYVIDTGREKELERFFGVTPKLD